MKGRIGGKIYKRGKIGGFTKGVIFLSRAGGGKGNEEV